MPYQNQSVDETLKMVKARQAQQGGGPAYTGESFENLISQYRQQNANATYTDALKHVMKNHPESHSEYLRRKNRGRDIGR